MPEYAKVIRDPIHGYIALSRDELSIVETPYFQRLRFIHQNGTAYLTYPSCSNTRFEHSLGVLYIARRMFDAVLQNSEQEEIEEYIKRCSEVLQVCLENVKQTLHCIVSYTALLHDIGHLPFSHLTESAISRPLYARRILAYKHAQEFQEWRQRYNLKFHEYASLKIIDTKFHSIIGVKYCEWITNVLKSNPEKQPRDIDPVFATLKELISSDVDADRADYLTRDGRVSGAGFGGYDIERLVQTLRLHRDRNGVFRIRPVFVGMSAVETFLTERYKLYRWVYFHHKVVFTDEVFTYILRKLCDASLSWNSCKGLFDPETLRFDKYVTSYETRDDIYLLEKFRQFYRILSQPDTDIPMNDRRVLRALLEIILFRSDKGGSVWKDTFQYKQFSDDEFKKSFNRSLIKKYREKSDEFAREPSELVRWVSPNSEILNYTNSEIFEKAGEDGIFRLQSMINRSRDYFVLVARRAFSALSNDSQIIDRTGEVTQSLSDGSGLLRELSTCWNGDVQIFLYYVPLTKRFLKTERLDWRNMVKRRFCETFERWYEESPTLKAFDEYSNLMSRSRHN
jgi:HD superfamily phosphohydrolase